ncbi:hypothetical protein ISS04_02465 [Candidatus Woesearchaeota archaeon]|nr:hypothetical protein [Candidatus Woesearchaeota archaeon]
MRDQNLEKRLGKLIKKFEVDKNSLISFTEITDYTIEKKVSLPRGNYFIDGDIIIKKKGSLDIKPGSELYFGTNAGIITYGCLNAKGTKRDNILFTAKKDNWKNISIFNRGEKESELEYCKITKGSGRNMGDLIVEKEMINFLKGRDISIKTNVGGGMLIVRSNPSIKECEITRNEAFHGGGIYLAVSNLELRFNSINNNKALSGGGIYLVNSELKLKDLMSISNNEVEDCGGGICASNSGLELNETFMRSNKNTSVGDGGGIYMSLSTLKMNESVIEKNEVSKNQEGGGIYITKSIAIIKKSLIESNIAKEGNGGGINAYLSNIFMSDNSIKNNVAKYGGGAYIHNCDTFSIKDTSIMYNSAEKGGGVYYWKTKPNDLGRFKNKIVYRGEDPIEFGNRVRNNAIDNLYSPDT